MFYKRKLYNNVDRYMYLNYMYMRINTVILLILFRYIYIF